MIPQSKPGNRLSVHVGDQHQQRQSNHLRRVGEGPLCPTKDSVNEFLQFYFKHAKNLRISASFSLPSNLIHDMTAAGCHPHRPQFLQNRRMGHAVSAPSLPLHSLFNADYPSPMIRALVGKLNEQW